MRRHRILRIITRLNVGGPAIQAAILTSRLDQDRFETLLVAGREGPSEGNMLELGRLGDHVRPLVVPDLGRTVSPLADVSALLQILRIAIRYHPDLVHTHLAKAGLVGRLAGRASGSRALVHTYHGSVFRDYFGGLKTGLYLTLERSLARITTRIIAVTTRQREELIGLGIGTSKKVIRVELGLDLDPFLEGVETEVARAGLGLPARAPVVGIVARLVPIKDVATFVCALALIARSVPDVEGVIVGDGPERARLEALAHELGIATRCRFLGWRADMARVYGAVDVLALSSLNEGSPASLIEGMAAGRAVVATNVGGVPDVVRDGVTGSLVPPRAPEDLADAICQLLGDPGERLRFGRAARDEAAARWRADRLIHDIELLYGELLAA